MTATSSFSAGRVLVVEDDPDFAESLVDLLEPAGYVVRVASSIQTALGEFSGFSADVALIDVKLGTENGVTLVPLLKRRKELLACILMTGYASLDTAVEAVKNGADDYLFKPLEPSQLAERLRAAIADAQLAAHARKERRLSLLGQMAAGVAHDINNYLQAMLLDVDDGQDALQHPADLERASERFESLRAAVHACADICHRMVTFAKGQGTRGRADLAHVLGSSDGLLQKLAGPQLLVLIEVATEPLRVACGPTELQQVLMNLVVNAAHASRPGGTIRLRGEREEHGGRSQVLLTVSDEGEGIPEAVLPRIFDPYFTTKPRHLGSGLGLSLVHGIVTGAGGDVRVESEPGRGTRFYVRLPEPEPADARATIPPPSRVSRAPEHKLLIVDDFDPLLRSLRRVFEREGFASVCESSCESALATFEARSDEFLAVISDVSMPGMSGLELARLLHATHEDLPIVLMSGDEHVPESLNLGPRTLFLRKPFPVEAVIDWLVSLVDR